MNFVNLVILSGGRKQNLNVRGAWLHVMADALGSVGAIAAGASDLLLRLAVGRPGRVLRDRRPWCSISVMGAGSRETLDVLMEGVPRRDFHRRDHRGTDLALPGCHRRPRPSRLVALRVGATLRRPTSSSPTDAESPSACIDAANRTLAERFSISHSPRSKIEHDERCRQVQPVRPRRRDRLSRSPRLRRRTSRRCTPCPELLRGIDASVSGIDRGRHAPARLCRTPRRRRRTLVRVSAERALRGVVEVDAWGLRHLIWLSSSICSYCSL